MNPLRMKSLRAVLAAWLLVMATSGSTVRVHAHELVADHTTHQHKAGTACTCSHGPEPACSADDQLRDTPHTHLQVFGLEFSLPRSGALHQSPVPEHRCSLSCLLPGMQHTGLAVPFVRVLSDQGHPLLLTLPTMDADGSSLQRVIVMSAQVPIAAYLCDAARHERSGVQLA